MKLEYNKDNKNDIKLINIEITRIHLTKHRITTSNIRTHINGHPTYTRIHKNIKLCVVRKKRYKAVKTLKRPTLTEIEIQCTCKKQF